MKNIFLLPGIFLVLLSSCTSDKLTKTEVNTLAETSLSWNGDSLPSYPDGTPQVSILKYTIPPKTKLDMHKHPEINAGVLLKGSLTVVSEKMDTLYLEEGEAIVELVDQFHYGMNEGSKPAEIIVFYAGVQGSPLVIPKTESSEKVN